MFKAGNPTCCSMLSSISPWASTSTAMSRKIWCSSIRLFSSSFTASCRSLISAKVSNTCTRCHWPSMLMFMHTFLSCMRRFVSCRRKFMGGLRCFVSCLRHFV